MGILKYAILGLVVACASAQSSKQKTQSTKPSTVKNTLQQRTDAIKQDYVPIYLYARESSLDGDYNYRYETANGIYAEERGEVLNKGAENQANSVVGSYRYISPEGTPIEVTYTAGVDGFRAYGAHLPVAPTAPTLVKNLSFRQNPASAPFSRPQFRSVDTGTPVIPEVENKQQVIVTDVVQPQQNPFDVSGNHPGQIQLREPDYQQQVILNDRSDVDQRKSSTVVATTANKEGNQPGGVDGSDAIGQPVKDQSIQEPVLKQKIYIGAEFQRQVTPAPEKKFETFLSTKRTITEPPREEFQNTDVIKPEKPFEPIRSTERTVAELPQVTIQGAANIKTDQNYEPFRSIQPVNTEQTNAVLQGAPNSLPGNKYEPIRSAQPINVEKHQFAPQETPNFQFSQSFDPVGPVQPVVNEQPQVVFQGGPSSQSDQRYEPSRPSQPTVSDHPQLAIEQPQLVPVLRPTNFQDVSSQSKIAPVLQRVNSLGNPQRVGGRTPYGVSPQQTVQFNQQRSAELPSQISVEPQLLWLLQPGQPGRYFQYPIMHRTLQPPRY
ncbi:uncharacterized protein LOC126835376 [Adelges cooleyi]|uniref:uncharacterized protein LOC126835376 n=1 Tax=Adelges cooleyi TaxID=133065 RepID=UPI00217FA736|nr:uncharacterized protein LOC126835376 [Adelges cooleyi]